MKYTLFIDESGDFKHFNPQKGWVISGVLCPGKRKQAEKAIEEAVSPVAKRQGLHLSKEVHLTELRKVWSNHTKVGDFAKAVLHAASDTGARFAAVINEGEARMREPERTYRLMVLDLLAVVDAIAPHDLSSLDLVVAQRKKYKAEERMSTSQDLLSDVIERVEDSVEAGIAARGLLNRLDAGVFVIEKAEDRWSLGVADAVANLTFNREYPESGDVLEEFSRKGLYRAYEAFGEYGERRARVAERDGDLSGALVRWALLDSSQQQDIALDRVIGQAKNRGTTGPKATLNAAIELLWRNHRSDVVGALQAIERSLKRTMDSCESQASYQTMLYRVRDMMHMIANHRGDLERATRLQKLQEALDAKMASDPATLPLVLKSQFHRITTAELHLDLEATLLSVLRVAGIVDTYREVINFLRIEMEVDESDESEFIRSRQWIKARTSLVRGHILTGKREHIEKARKELKPLVQNTEGKDLARARQYCVWLEVRAGQYKRSLQLARQLLHDGYDDPFSLMQAARAGAFAAILGSEKEGTLRNLLEVIRPHMQSGGEPRYPYDLLWRNIGVLEWSVGKGSRSSRRAFDLALDALNQQEASPAIDWRRYGIDLMKKGTFHPDAEPPSVPQSVGALAEEIPTDLTANDTMRAYLRVSPY